jgi:hypothetical protein
MLYPESWNGTTFGFRTAPEAFGDRRKRWGTVGSNSIKPPKIGLKNSWNWHITLMPATIWKTLKSEAHAKIGNGSYEKLVKSLWVNLFSASLSQLEFAVRGRDDNFRRRTAFMEVAQNWSQSTSRVLLKRRDRLLTFSTGDSAVGLVYF